MIVPVLNILIYPKNHIRITFAGVDDVIMFQIRKESSVAFEFIRSILGILR